MFDDYRFKNRGKRFEMKFRQIHEETIYPWEIANFLTELNTSYYKYELLNSVSSAIKHGIPPSDIFILDSSLPLYKRYSNLNLLSEHIAASVFYRIGRPYPLVPSRGIYDFNLIYSAFAEINSFLFKHHVKPLLIKNLEATYRVMQEQGLDEAERHIVDIALNQSILSHQNAVAKNKPTKLLTEADINGCLEAYRKRKTILIQDIDALQGITTQDLSKLEESTNRVEIRRAKLYSIFFYYFQKTSRPLVCARVAEGKFRVLGRSLVNKTETNGLELIQATRNSPLLTEIQGGVSLIQTVLGIGHAREMQKLQLEEKKLQIQEKKLDIEIKKRQLEKLDIELQRLDLETFNIKKDVLPQITASANQSDITAIKALPDSPTKELLAKAYGIEHNRAQSLLVSRGLVLQGESTRVIDVEV